jgi:hypothetical protein
VDGIATEAPQWVFALGRLTLREMKLEAIRMEENARAQMEETFRPEFQSLDTKREEAWKKKDDILARNRAKKEGLNKWKKVERKEKQAELKARNIPERTHELGQLLKIFQGRKIPKTQTQNTNFLVSLINVVSSLYGRWSSKSKSK